MSEPTFVDYFNAFLSLPVMFTVSGHSKDITVECVFSRTVIKLQHLTVLMCFTSTLRALGSEMGCYRPRIILRSMIGQKYVYCSTRTAVNEIQNPALVMWVFQALAPVFVFASSS